MKKASYTIKLATNLTSKDAPAWTARNVTEKVVLADFTAFTVDMFHKGNGENWFGHT